MPIKLVLAGALLLLAAACTVSAEPGYSYGGSGAYYAAPAYGYSGAYYGRPAYSGYGYRGDEGRGR
jgi:hypothetical protein